jgi:D-alanyl-D-alanine carboxypeptidase
MVKPGSAVQTASVLPLHMPRLGSPSETPKEAPSPAAARAEVPPPAPPPPPSARAGVLGALHVRASAGIGHEAPPSAKPQARSGWIIQVGAFTAEQEAKQRLSAVQSKAAKLLAAADPFTEPVLKGDTTYYRARFAGLDKEQAEAACKYLKKNDVDCVTIKN